VSHDSRSAGQSVSGAVDAAIRVRLATARGKAAEDEEHCREQEDLRTACNTYARNASTHGGGDRTRNDYRSPLAPSQSRRCALGGQGRGRVREGERGGPDQDIADALDRR
jgi:hypothetical protein